MPIIRKPFVNYTLDENKKNPFEVGKTFTIRINAEEYNQLLEVMQILHISNASTALKFMASVGKNVIFTSFNADDLRWLTDGSRRVDDSKLNKLAIKKEENVLQKTANL